MISVSLKGKLSQQEKLNTDETLYIIVQRITNAEFGLP